MNLDEHLQEHIVAFIDILGSTEAIKKDEEKSLKVMHDSYTEAIKLFDYLFEDKQIKPKVKIFSDNIVVAVPRLKESGHGAFCAVVMLSAIIQVQFLKHGLLTRGGIASGSFFCDELMVWGKGLVKAYGLESTVAIYPRIIIDPELIRELGLTRSDCLFKKTQKWIVQDEDSLFVVDYINEFLQNKDFFGLVLLNIVEEKLGEFSGNIKICQKWLWLSNYISNKLFSENEADVNGGKINGLPE